MQMMVAALVCEFNQRRRESDTSGWQAFREPFVAVKRRRPDAAAAGDTAAAGDCADSAAAGAAAAAITARDGGQAGASWRGALDRSMTASQEFQ